MNAVVTLIKLMDFKLMNRSPSSAWLHYTPTQLIQRAGIARFSPGTDPPSPPYFKKPES